MLEEVSEQRPVGVLRWVIAGIAAFLLVLYLRSVWGLVATAGEMENKFSKLASERYLPFLVWQNIRVGLAYLAVGVAGVVLLWPVVLLWLGRRRSGRFGVFWRAFAAAALMHGYFVLRLVQARPYFVSEDYYGNWFYRLLEFPPEPLRSWLVGLLFGVLPWFFGGWLVLWYGRRMWRAGRVGKVACAVAGVVVLVMPVVAWVSRSGSKPARVEEGAAPNIVILASDSLRGDRLGFTGYRPGRSDGLAAGGVSPRIDGLTEDSQVFGKCFTPLASTIESTASLMSSSYPHSHGIRQMYPDRETMEKSNSSLTTLAGVLRQKGYDTAAIGDWCAAVYEVMPMDFEHIDVSTFDNFRVYMTQAVFIEHFVVPLYLDNPVGYLLFPEVQSFAEFVTPEVVTDRVLDRLAERAGDGQPFFWHVFYSCNHLPYRAPEPYSTMFADPAYRGASRSSVVFDVDEFIGGTDLENKWRALPDSEMRQVGGLYDGCTRMFDDCVGRVLDGLKEHGLDGNTIVVVSADHGDDLYEPGVTLGHGLGFNGGDQANHVPLVMRVPGRAGRRFEEPVRTIDVAPTLAGLAGAEIPEVWEGQSLAPWIEGREEPRPRPVYAETGFPFIQFEVDGVVRPELPPMDEMTFIDEDFNYQFVLRPEFVERVLDAKERCLRTERWKLVCTPLAAGGRVFRLHYLPDDPHCQQDVAAGHPQVLDALKRALEGWIDDRRETPYSTIFPDGEP